MSSFVEQMLTNYEQQYILSPMAINQTLKKLGLNDNEIKIYLALLKGGKTKHSALAKITKINRTTVYHAANELLSKGIITEDFSEKTSRLVPLPPRNLEVMVKKEMATLKEKESLVKKAIGELSMITASSEYSVPKIRFVEEDNLEDFLYENLEKWQEDILRCDGVWWGFQDHTLIEGYEKWIDSTWKTRSSKNPNYKGQLFSNSSKIKERMKKKLYQSKRDIRPMEGVNFTSTIWVCGDYLIMVFTKQHPFYLVEIHDKAMAHNMRELFKKLWGDSSAQN